MPEVADTVINRPHRQIAESREVQEVAEPNLLRDMFPYHAVPRIIFDGAVEPLDPAPEFLITDTTFRDGQQARPPYTAGQIVDLFKMLHRLGGPRGVIRQSEFFLYSRGGPRGGAQVPGAGLRISRDHRMDPRRGRGPKAGP